MSNSHACYVGDDLLDKQQFIDYYNSEVVQLLTSSKSSPVCSDDSKNLSKQDFVNACKLLVGFARKDCFNACIFSK
jgi:hypothetical protein